ncbi:MAG TPA: hypothetical protein VF625_00080 [Longimicrobium sp.]|jgi:hypothetical protein
MDFLLPWADRWGNLAGIADLFLSIVGFGATLYGLWRATTAAKAAATAAQETRETLLRSGNIAELATAMSVMEEIKRLHRVGAWPLLLDRYAILRRSLISVRSSTPHLGEEGSKTLQTAIRHFFAIEQAVEEAVDTGVGPANVPKLNKLVSQQIDKLEELLTSLRTGSGA